jgi:hypothetical protein
MRKQELLKLYQTYRIYIFPSGVAVASLILIALIIYPQTISLLTNQKAKTEISTQSQFLEAKAQELGSYNPQDLNQKVNYAVSSYPTSKDYISAISTLQNLIFQSGFTVSTLSLLGDNSKDAKASFLSYTVKVEILGPLPSLPTLLASIENAPRLMRVGTIEVTPGKDPKIASAAIAVEVLYSPAKGDLGSVDSPLPKLSDKEEQVIQKLANIVGTVKAQGSTQITTPAQLGPRGKANPFE